MYRAGPWKRTDGGFTLLEVTVVAALAALIVVLAMPRFQVLLTPDVDRDVRGELENLVMAVRQEAVLARVPMGILFDLREGTYRSVLVRPDGTVDLENDPVARVGRLPKGMRFTDISTPRQEQVRQGQCVAVAWPTGWIDPTAIHLLDDARRPHTLLIEPLSAQVRWEEGFVVRRKAPM